nr:MobV family relaxase [uncultured Eisenbergiella sp.]
MHVAKYHAGGGLGNLYAHYERENNEERNYSNQDIDKSRTEQNYNLAPVHEEGLYEFTKNRVNELGVVRKTQVWSADWVVTAPCEIKEDGTKCQEFFDKAYQFMETRYGAENTVSAYVHMDETTPHMHYCFVPVQKENVCSLDKATGTLNSETREKLCAKEVLNRRELRTIHKDIQAYMDRELDYKVSVTTGKTSLKGNVSLKELKEQKVIAEQNESLKTAQKALLRQYEMIKRSSKQLHEETEKQAHMAEEIANSLQNEILNKLDQYDAFHVIPKGREITEQLYGFVKASEETVERTDRLLEKTYETDDLEF